MIWRHNTPHTTMRVQPSEGLFRSVCVGHEQAEWTAAPERRPRPLRLSGSQINFTLGGDYMGSGLF